VTIASAASRAGTTGGSTRSTVSRASSTHERLDVTLRATSQFELDNVLADLPPRRRPSRVAVFEAAAGVFLLLAFSAAAPRAAGAALALGAVAPPLRWRPLATAFLAGVALVAAPLAALPLVASAGWRWVSKTP